MINWRRWGPILFGVAVLLVFAAIGGVFFTAVWVREHLSIEAASANSAQESFDAIRQEFGSKPALVTVKDGIVDRHDPPADAPRAAISALHVLAWDPDEEQMARFEIPFWFLRLKETPIQFGTYASGLDQAGFTLRARDIERHGPGIIIDAEMRQGERALVWAR